jgi:hypothetical protein
MWFLQIWECFFREGFYHENLHLTVFVLVLQYWRSSDQSSYNSEWNEAFAARSLANPQT